MISVMCSETEQTGGNKHDSCCCNPAVFILWGLHESQYHYYFGRLNVCHLCYYVNSLAQEKACQHIFTDLSLGSVNT